MIGFVGSASSVFIPATQASRISTKSPFTIHSTRRVNVSSVSSSQIRMASPSSPEAIDWNAMGAKFQKDNTDPTEIMDVALAHFGDSLGIAFSGAEDVAVIEYAKRTGKKFRVFALDTGRLHPETYRYYAEVEKYYGIKIEYCFPDAGEVEALVNEKGLFSFYEDGHQECCRVRKVRPLRKKLSTLKAWVTGQRKDQSPGTRNEVPVCQVDPAFKGVGDHDLIKFNPLANVSSADVWGMIRMVEIPYNSLHERGFISIGCEPCTKPVLPNQHEREGRWWWEEATQKECGLHKGNISQDAVIQEKMDNMLRDMIASDKVVFFSKSTCKYCAEVRTMFEKMAIPFSEFKLDLDLEKGADIGEALKRLTKQSTVPNVFIGKRHIGTADNTKALLAEGKLVQLLNEVGIKSKSIA